MSVARGLGVFSLALGAAELCFPKAVNKALGVNAPLTTRAFGLREIASGVGILCSKNPAPWLWARVAGDVADLAALGVGQRYGRLRNTDERVYAGLAVLGVTALDVWCALALSAQDKARAHDMGETMGAGA